MAAQSLDLTVIPLPQDILRHLHSVPKEAAKYLSEAGTLQDLTIDVNKTSTWKAN